MKYLLFILITLSLQTKAFAQNLDTMENDERTKVLLRIAKASVMEYGPDFYREYRQPKIEHRYVGKSEQDLTVDEEEDNPGRSFYTVEYPYDETEESFDWFYAAKVYIWSNKGAVFSIKFGNCFCFCDLDKPKTRSQKENLRMHWKKQFPRKKRVPKQIKVEYKENRKGQNGK